MPYPPVGHPLRSWGRIPPPRDTGENANMRPAVKKRPMSRALKRQLDGLKGLIASDPEKVGTALAVELLPDAISNLRDGLRYRSRWGAPSRGFLRMYMEMAKLVKQDERITQLTLNVLGVGVREARASVEAAKVVEEVAENPASLAQYMLGWLDEYFGAMGKRVVVLEAANEISAGSQEG